jgi:GntR family transcriptional regulator, transcriptional repressor for pyruvate dehydrogenase complex
MHDSPEVRFARLERAPAYKIVSDAILKDIIGGRLQIGNRLPSEQKLAEQFGVNRSTVREGIRLLEETGVLRREFGKRLVVSRPTYDDVGGRLSRAMILHEVTFRELWETIMAIEPATAALAARKRSASDLDLIAENIARTRAALSDGQALVSLDIEFHSLVARAAANRAIVLAREALSQLIYPAFRAVLVDGSANVAGPRLLAAHEAIAQAIADSDTETTWKWMERHISDFRKAYEVLGFKIDAPLQPSGRN